MAKLRDVRRRFPPEDAEAYTRAYAAAALAEEVGELVHGLRLAAGLDEAELAARMGVDEDEVVRAEEGDASLTVAFLDAVARATGTHLRVAARGDGLEVALGAWRSPAPQTGA